MRELKVSRGVVLAAGVVLAVLLGALAVVLVGSRGSDGGGGSAQAERQPAVEAEVTVGPREVLFGDSVRARVDTVVDKARVDPTSVRVQADFDPWEVVGSATTTRQDDGDDAYIRTTYVLRCITGTCVPSGQSERYDFRPGRITYGAPADQPVDESSIDLPLPSIRVFSRFAAGTRDADPFEPAWRADVLTLPAVSYGISPGLLMVLLLGGAAVLAVGGLALAFAAWPRRLPAPPPEPPPAPPPAPALSPLEQALVLLELSIRTNGAADQRRALEQVAEQLELAEWGDERLAHEAKVLAWSPDAPPIEKTTSLAARVRSALPEVEEPDDEETNGRV